MASRSVLMRSGRVSVIVCVLATLLPKTSASDGPPVVRIDSGLVSGVQMEVAGKQLDAYLGIPYAEPPVGKLRFKRPRPVSPWRGVYNATSMPPACRQVSVSLFGFATLNYSQATEDCLYVNVWKPSQPSCSKGRQNCEGRPLPVVVYFHGGGFQWGDSALMIYDPANFVALTDVVFVTFNYRLGFFGFLSLDTEQVPGNVGLWDQNLVLKWVNKNIASFGGNPEEVTIAGHSAGATSVALHAASPHSKDLFRRVIMQSGAPVTMVLTLFFSGQGKFINIAGSLGCYDTNATFDDQLNDVVSCLRQLDAGFVIQKLENVNFLKRMFAPVDNDEFLPFSVLSSKPWQNLNVENVLLGTTANEGTMFFHFLQSAFSAVDEMLTTQYRTVSTVVLSQALHIPISEAREIVFSYFGDYGVEHSYEEVRDVISDMFADAVFNCPTQLFAEDAAQQGIGTHRYIFSYKPTHSFFPEWMGVAHTEDVFYTMGSLPFLKDPTRYTSVFGPLIRKYFETQDYTAQEYDFMKDIVAAWGTFVKTGKPVIPRADAVWPAYSQDARQILVLRPNNFTVVSDANVERCDLWRPVLYRKDVDKVSEVTPVPKTKPRSQGSPNTLQKKINSGNEQSNEASSTKRFTNPLTIVIILGFSILLFKV